MRLSGMALAGPSPGAADRQEMHRMGSEKLAAFSQGWQAMCMAAWTMPLRLAPAFATAFWGGRSPAALHEATARAAVGLMSAGVSPMHRTVVANAKRLRQKAAGGR